MAIVVAVASTGAIHEWLIEWIVGAETIIRGQPVLGKFLFILFAAVSAMLAFVSSAVVVPVAVLAWGKAVSMLLLWTGWTLGGMAAYGLSRILGRTVLRRVTPRAAIEAYEKVLPRDAPFGLILLFQTALPSEVPGYLLGLARYPFRKYLAALTISELPYAIATIYLGEGFLQRRVFLLIALGVVMAAFSGWTLYWLRGRVQRGS
jgi:uncharacterized membrane protein YdjX (TVP38/TMEM64 family)